jgi:hypothetical protein
VPADWLDGAGIAIEHLRTPYGELSYTLRRAGKRTHLAVAAGVKPPGGFVLAGPLGGPANRSVRIDGERAEWNGTELHFSIAPAEITIE